MSLWLKGITVLIFRRGKHRCFRNQTLITTFSLGCSDRFRGLCPKEEYRPVVLKFHISCFFSPCTFWSIMEERKSTNHYSSTGLVFWTCTQVNLPDEYSLTVSGKTADSESAGLTVELKIDVKEQQTDWGMEGNLDIRAEQITLCPSASVNNSHQSHLSSHTVLYAVYWIGDIWSIPMETVMNLKSYTSPPPLNNFLAILYHFRYWNIQLLYADTFYMSCLIIPSKV